MCLVLRLFKDDWSGNSSSPDVNDGSSSPNGVVLRRVLFHQSLL